MKTPKMTSANSTTADLWNAYIAAKKGGSLAALGKRDQKAACRIHAEWVKAEDREQGVKPKATRESYHNPETGREVAVWFTTEDGETNDGWEAVVNGHLLGRSGSDNPKRYAVVVFHEEPQAEADIVTGSYGVRSAHGHAVSFHESRGAAHRAFTHATNRSALSDNDRRAVRVIRTSPWFRSK